MSSSKGEHYFDSSRIIHRPCLLPSFAAKGEAKQEVLWDVLAEWAAVLVENQVRMILSRLMYQIPS